VAARWRWYAWRLADALRRDSVVSIYIPPPESRAQREVCRGRHQLVRLRTRLAQMIRALLLRCDAGEPPSTTLFAARALGRGRDGIRVYGTIPALQSGVTGPSPPVGVRRRQPGARVLFDQVIAAWRAPPAERLNVLST